MTTNVEALRLWNEHNDRIKAIKAERSPFDSQVREIAHSQIRVAMEQIKAMNLDLRYNYDALPYDLRDYARFDYFEFDESTGTLEMWERGTCGDSDSCLGTFRFDELFIDGREGAYKLKIMERIEAHTEQRRQEKRADLQKQIDANTANGQRLRDQLAAV